MPRKSKTASDYLNEQRRILSSTIERYAVDYLSLNHPEVDYECGDFFDNFDKDVIIEALEAHIGRRLAAIAA